MRWLARLARRLRRDEHGTVAVETVLIAPLLILGLFFSYEAYGLFRQQSLREKATYTVADILSRETAIINDTYIDNVKRVFDMMSGTADSQLRISVVRYRNDPSQGIDEFDLRWSEVRGTGTMTALTDSVVRNAHDTFPIMDDGEEIIYVESRGTFTSPVATGYFNENLLATRMFVIPRFAPQICFTGTCVPGTS
ncbi:TadE/TadG family type IV pilus assembly protein [Roseovarius nitratireducens]|uniref:TadE/TadG family type IV pilus assembly protein n=1 Tax=Roseovarius nitratireducens TaxID=2044597 RepID=UPI000CE20D4D|nr:pilus assembly protein [Roseovarius nitratireducens]